MLLRNLVLQRVGAVYQVNLYPDGNFEKETTILGNSFSFKVRTYVSGYTYFSIRLNNATDLCVMTLARLGVNLCPSPTVTLDGKYHVFYLETQNPEIRQVHYSLFGNGIDLFYFQCPTYAVVDSIIL